MSSSLSELTHWGRVTHICVSKLTNIGSDNGLSPGRRQAIIRTNAGILLIRHLGTNFSEISRAIHTFSFKKMHLKMSSGKWRPSCLGLNVLTEGYSNIDSLMGSYWLRHMIIDSAKYCMERSIMLTHWGRDKMAAIFQTTFSNAILNENVWISIKISLTFVPKGPINKIPALGQIMAWRRPGDKPLSESMMVSLPTHMCVTRPQWVKTPAIIHYSHEYC